MYKKREKVRSFGMSFFRYTDKFKKQIFMFFSLFFCWTVDNLKKKILFRNLVCYPAPKLTDPQHFSHQFQHAESKQSGKAEKNEVMAWFGEEVRPKEIAGNGEEMLTPSRR
jgi:hypothetical protein